MAKLPILATCGKLNATAFMEKIRPSLPTVKWEIITPEMAHKYLEANKDNRRKRSSTVAFYATAMEKEQWYVTHQTIAFDENDIMIDGQHRLEAVIKYGKPVLFLVVYGVPAETKRVCDQMLKRSADDVLRWAGEHYEGAAPSSVIRRMSMSVAWDYKISSPDVVLFSQEYHKHIQFALTCFPSNAPHISQAAIKAVIARAHYNKRDNALLKEFASRLYDGQTTSAPLSRFRTWLISNPGVRASVSIREVYAKCEQALEMFLNDQTLTKDQRLTGVTDELYPLPWDKQMAEEAKKKAAEQEDAEAVEAKSEPPVLKTRPRQTLAVRGRGRPRKAS